MKMQFGFEKMGGAFKVPPTSEEIQAARIAAGKALEEAKKIEKINKSDNQRMAQAREKIRVASEKDAPVHEITEEDLRDSEKETGTLLH